jgi:CheY-like chemotaxis protein
MTCRVLVVDDECVVRLLVARALESAGYTVLAAADGAEALDLLEQGGGVDLVLTDIRMPRLGGLELGREIARRQWPIPVLYMSADPTAALRSDGSDPSIPGCLAKPFSITDLGATVERLLRQRSAARAPLQAGTST